MERIAFRLKPVSGFHLGREGLAQESASEVFPSDSLFAALISTMARLFPEDKVKEFCNRFVGHEKYTGGTPPLRLSSVFPYIGDVLLLPKPLSLPSENNSKNGKAAQSSSSVSKDEPANAKALKKIEFVSPAIFQALLNGEDVSQYIDDDDKEKIQLQGKRVLVSEEELKQLPKDTDVFWQSTLVPRVSLDRISTASNIYQVMRTVFAPECGLWFMAEVEDEKTKSLLEGLLRVLADEGIGADRSSGYGAFIPEEIAAPQFNKGSIAVTLSRYNPTEDELIDGVLGEGALYQLVDVGGYLYTTQAHGQRRKRVRMIEAGAVLNTSKRVPIGRLVDVRPEIVGEVAKNAPAPPDHPVYRSGIALLAGRNANA